MPLKNNAYFINVFKSKHRLRSLGNFADVKKEEIQQDADKYLAIFYDGPMQTIGRCDHFTEFRKSLISWQFVAWSCNRGLLIDSSDLTSSQSNSLCTWIMRSTINAIRILYLDVFRTRKRHGNEGNLTFVSLVGLLRHPQLKISKGLALSASTLKILWKFSWSLKQKRFPKIKSERCSSRKPAAQ